MSCVRDAICPRISELNVLRSQLTLAALAPDNWNMTPISDPGGQRILLSFLRTTDSGDPFGFRMGPQEYVLPTEQGESPSAYLDWDQSLLSDLEQLRRSRRDPTVLQRVGERLRKFVWDAGFSRNEPEIRAAIERREPITITIRSSAAELFALPFELLTLRTGQTLGECDSLLLRYEWPDNPARTEQPSPRAEGGRILLAWSAAGGSVPANEHSQAITAAAKQAGFTFDSRRDMLAHASVERIVDTLAAAQSTGDPIAILHLLCHGTDIGSTFGLCLDGEDEAVSVDAAQLRAQLAPFANMVRLVILSACDSGNGGTLGGQLGSVAQTLQRCGFQAVIASRYPLSVVGSLVFAKTFYAKLLAVPCSVEAAFVAARRKLLLSDVAVPQTDRSLDWVSLQLYARHSDGEQTRPIVIRPYRGLLAFQPEHSRFFFGRERETEEILADLHTLVESGKPRLLICAGASGTGKSSLVFAGAIPKLLAADPTLVFLRMRPGSAPIQTLRDKLAELPPDRKGVLVVDQFEELFTQTKAADVREAFAQKLWALASAREPALCIILTMRIDYVGRCGELVLSEEGLRLDRVAYDESHRIFIAQMSPEQLRNALVLPARRVGLSLSDGLAERMLTEVEHEPGALPLLQDAMDTLWMHRQGNLLTQSAYDALGGVIGALQARAEAVTDKLICGGLGEILRRVLIGLVAVSEDHALDSRARVRLADLCAAQDEAEHDRMDEVVSELVAARLLSQDDDGQESTIEVAHEALIRKWPRLREWIDEDRAGLVQKRRVVQAAQQWLVASRDESLLLRGLQLAIAEEWRKTWNSRIGDRERAFLDASVALRTRNEEEIRQREQKEKETAALILKLLLDSYVEQGDRLLGEGRDEEGLLWLHRAYEQGSKSRSLPYLLKRAMQVLDARRAVFQTDLEDRLSFVELSPAGDRMVITDESGHAQILDAKNGRVLHRLEGRYGRPAVFDASGRQLLFCCANGSPVYDVESGGLSLVIPRSLQRASFCPERAAWIALCADGTLTCIDAQTTACLFEIPPKVERGSVLCWSLDGSLVLVATPDRSLQVLTLPALQPVGNFRITEDISWDAEFDRDGNRLLLFGYVAEGKRALTIFDVRRRKQMCRIAGLVGLDGTARFSPDGRFVVACREWSVASIYDAVTGRPICDLRGPVGSITAMASRSDGREIVTVSDDSSIRVFAPRFGLPIATTPIPHPHPAKELGAWGTRSPDGKYDIQPGEGTALLVFRTDTYDFVAGLSGHDRPITFIKYSPDGRWIVTSSEDGTSRLWSAETFRASQTLRGHTSRVTHAAFSADSERVITSSDDGTARLYDVETGFLLFAYSVAPAKVDLGSFGPDDTVVTYDSDGLMRTWDASPERRSPSQIQAVIDRCALFRFDPKESKSMAAKAWK